MGINLTGLTPATTYDALIKVGDNGPLSATAKVLSDGLGNDSALALSTTAVGIGTNTPSELLQVSKTQTATTRLEVTNAQTGGSTLIRASLRVTANDRIGELVAVNGDNVYVGAASNHNVALMSNGAAVLIGTPAGVIELPKGQLKFPATQVPSADANTLDDYEEGTWTMGVSFGGASVGLTTSANTGTYTKIGRQVTVNGYIVLTSKGISTGIAFLTGLPFTVGNTSGNFGAAPVWFNNITFANQFEGRFNQNQNYIELEEITEAGVASNLTDADFANNSGIMVSATYFV